MPARISPRAGEGALACTCASCRCCRTELVVLRSCYRTQLQYHTANSSTHGCHDEQPAQGELLWPLRARADASLLAREANPAGQRRCRTVGMSGYCRGWGETIPHTLGRRPCTLRATGSAGSFVAAWLLEPTVNSTCVLAVKASWSVRVYVAARETHGRV